MPPLPNSAVGEMSYKVSALERPLPVMGQQLSWKPRFLTLVKNSRAHRQAHRPTGIIGRQSVLHRRKGFRLHPENWV